MDEIEIVGYDPTWPKLFEAEAAAIVSALPAGMVLRIDHFGSTAVPGLAAKPVIDILIAVPSVPAARDPCVAALKHLDYVFWAENPRTDRLFFVKGMPPYGVRRTHHVHVREADALHRRDLAFRDLLRAQPETARRYETLKRDLARRFSSDREAYTQAKTEFIDGALGVEWSPDP